MPETAEVSAADIARLAGVSRGTVSNWRRRHADFPAPRGGTDASPAYDRAEVEAWLLSRDMLPEPSADERLWRVAMQAAGRVPLNELMMQATRLLGELDECVERYRPDLVYDEARLAKVKVRATAEARAGAGDPDFVAALLAAAAKRGSLDIMDSLFERYADSTGLPSTPPPVAALMAELTMLKNAKVTVFDPAAGTGELLAAVFAHDPTRHLRGQELDAGLAALADLRLNMFKEDGPLSATVTAGDSLCADQFPDLQADVVLCHPPFGDREWGAEELAHDPRWLYGTPPKAEPELAWAQHCLAHLKPGGTAALLLPPAVASRASGRRIRAELLRRGALRAVIALPPGAVRPRHVPVHLWLLTRPGDRVRLDPRVLLVDGASAADREAEEGEGGGTRAGWDGFRAMTLRAWQAFTAAETAGTDAPEGTEIPAGWRIARAIDLLDESVDVSPVRHVAPPQAALSPASTRDEARALSRRLRAALATAEASLPGEDWRPADSGRGWRAMTVDDLVRAGMAELHRASSKRQEIPLRPGDVIVSAVAGASRGTVVVTRESLAAEDGGAALGPHEHLVRPVPELLDPWFLAGFLAAPANVRQASYGTAATRIDARRLTVPQLPIDEQRRYSAVFRRLRELTDAVTRVNELATELAGLLAWSLADGSLLPRDSDETPGGPGR